MPGRIRPVEFDRARNTAQNGSKFMDLHPGRIGYHPNEFNWIYSQFDRARNTAQNGSKFMDLHPGQIGYHPNELTPIFSNISCPVEFDQA